MFNTFNSTFSYTKNLFNQWPVIKTSDTTDYSQADQYPMSKYVWLADSNTEFRDEFYWNWAPENEEQEYMIHTFPKCVQTTKKPANWNVLKLVPTDPSKRIAKEVKHPLISSYAKNVYPIFFYALNDRFALKKFISKPEDRSHQLVKSQSNFLDVLREFNTDIKEKWVWFIDIDTDLDIHFNFEYTPEYEDEIYCWKVHNTTSDLVYADGSIVLVSLDYIKKVQAGEALNAKYVEVDNIAGILNDLYNPERAWVRAYRTTALLLNKKHSVIDKKLKTKIVDSYAKIQNTRLADYAKDGMETARKDLDNKEDMSQVDDFTWLETRFKTRQQQINDTRVDDASIKRVERIGKVYGTDSDEYLKAVEKLKSV